MILQRPTRLVVRTAVFQSAKQSAILWWVMYALEAKEDKHGPAKPIIVSASLTQCLRLDGKVTRQSPTPDVMRSKEESRGPTKKLPVFLTPLLTTSMLLIRVISVDGWCNKCKCPKDSDRHRNHQIAFRAASRKVKEKRRAAGLCQGCGDSLDSDKHHLWCLVRVNDRRSQQAERGLCRAHTQRPAVSKGRCEECWIKRITINATGSVKAYGAMVEDRKSVV